MPASPASASQCPIEVTPMEVIMAREAGRTSIGNDNRRADLHVMEEPLGVRNVHADAAV